ncbi:MAG: hypothetical protein RIM72_11255 [Alphaproteobacteria bacterium]
MSDNSRNNPPVQTLRDGTVKASIWKNEAENGPFYSTTFSRTFTDKDGNNRDTQSFAGTDLLKVSELAREAYGQSRDLHRQDREAARQDFKQQRESAPRRDNRDRTR